MTGPRGISWDGEVVVVLKVAGCCCCSVSVVVLDMVGRVWVFSVVDGVCGKLVGDDERSNGDGLNSRTYTPIYTDDNVRNAFVRW